MQVTLIFKAVSAGFYRITILYDVFAYGNSESLNLSSRSIDSEYIKKAILDSNTNAFIE